MLILITITELQSSHCYLDTLDGTKIKGKIVICNQSASDYSATAKAEDLKSNGAVGAVFIDDFGQSVALSYIDFPATHVTTEGSNQIREYIHSTK